MLGTMGISPSLPISWLLLLLSFGPRALLSGRFVYFSFIFSAFVLVAFFFCGDVPLLRGPLKHLIFFFLFCGKNETNLIENFLLSMRKAIPIPTNCGFLVHSSSISVSQTSNFHAMYYILLEYLKREGIAFLLFDKRVGHCSMNLKSFSKRQPVTTRRSIASAWIS